MRNRVFLNATAFAMLLPAWGPPTAEGQSPPASALVNQRSQETLEAARAVSPHTAEETFAYHQDEVEAAIAKAIERVWDPTQPRARSPRTPWGDPELGGYWMSNSYTPLERPDELPVKRFTHHRRRSRLSSARSSKMRRSIRQQCTMTGWNLGWTTGKTRSDQVCALP